MTAVDNTQQIDSSPIEGVPLAEYKRLVEDAAAGDGTALTRLLDFAE